MTEPSRKLEWRLAPDGQTILPVGHASTVPRDLEVERRPWLWLLLAALVGLLFAFPPGPKDQSPEAALTAYEGPPPRIPSYLLPKVPDLDPVLSKCGSKAPDDLESIILRAGELTGINPKLIATQIVVESRCNPDAIGGVGEVGLMQIYPKYWPWSRADLKDPEFNAWAGAEVLRKISREGERSPQQVLKRYNGSPKYAVKVSDLYWQAFREPVTVNSTDLNDLSL